MNDQPDYYRLPDHGHRAENEYRSWPQIGLIAVSGLISALSVYLLGDI
jgi:hypothetical protein